MEPNDNTYSFKSNAIIGEKLNNPYSVSNMRIAYSNLLNANSIPPSSNKIQVSHLYVMFENINSADYDLLKADSTLIIYSYPLDYEMQEPPVNGYYSYSADSISNYFASVKINKRLPSVNYQILDSLFIPEETDNYNLQISKDDLVNEALNITGNLKPGEGYKSSNWTPAGTITLWDDNLVAYFPLEGVIVKARRWFTTYVGTTNANGYFQCNGSFKNDANYSLVFERYDFEVRDSWLGTAGINGPKKTGNWDLNIINGKDEFHATIFKAAHHYYYKDIKSLRRPPLNSYWHTKLKLRAFYETNENNGTHCPACRFLGLGSAIKIYNPQNPSQEIYGTTIHEMAHASHWKMSSWHYNHSDDILAESWARGVQWELTRMVYPGYQPAYGRLNYTGIVQDMIDGFSTKGTSYWWDYDEDTWGSPNLFRSYNDQVSGYSIRQIEDAVNGEIHWNNWKDKIINSYNNATENNLANSFNYWNTY